jgi:hypothetical protein
MVRNHNEQSGWGQAIFQLLGFKQGESLPEMGVQERKRKALFHVLGKPVAVFVCRLDELSSLTIEQTSNIATDLLVLTNVVKRGGSCDLSNMPAKDS